VITVITLKKKILAILCICALACVIFSGCTQSSPSESFTEQKTCTGTIKNIIYNQRTGSSPIIYQIILEDGTWMITQTEESYTRTTIHNEDTDTVISKDVCFKCLKIGHTYEMSFKRIDSQAWMLYNIKDA